MVLPQQGGENLGTAYARVRLDASGVQAGMNQAQQIFRNGLDQIGASFQRVGTQMSSLGTNMSLALAPFTAFGATGLRAASDFDAAMNAISARTGLVGESLNEVSALAQQLGADTVFSSQQAADAFLQMLTAGLDVEAAIATLPNVLNAAAASGEDLGRSADLVTNVMASFRLEAGETTRIVESMSRASASSPASMGEMGEALQVIGGLATNMGMSLEETSATLALFAQSGIRGSEAGTALRSMLMNMTRDTADVQSAWAELGVSMYDAEGNTRNLNDVFLELDAALQTRSPEEQNRMITTLAGSYGLAGFNALRAGTSIEEMQAIMEGQASATDVAAARMDTFRGTITSLMGSIETLQIALFTNLMNNTLKPLAAQLIVMVNSVTAWAQENPALVQTIMTVVGAMSAFFAALIPVGLTISAVGASLSSLAPLFSVLLGPIGAVIGAAGLLYLAWQRNVFQIQDRVAPVLERLRDVLNIAGQGIRSTLGALAYGLDVFDAVEVGIGGTLGRMLVAAGVSQAIADRIQGAFIGAVQQIEQGFNRIPALASQASANIQAAGGVIGTALNDVADGVRVILTGDFQGGMFSGATEDSPIVDFWFDIRDTIVGVLNLIRPAISEFTTFVANAFRQVNLGEVANIGRTLFEVGMFLLNLTNPIGIVMNVLRLFGVSFMDIFSTITTAFTTFFATLNSGGGLGDAIGNALGGGEGAGQAATGVIAGIVNAFNTIVSFMQGTVLPAFQQVGAWFISDGLPVIVTFITGTVVPAVQGFISTLSNIWTAVAPTLMALADWFITSALPLIMQTINTVAIPAIQFFAQVISDIWAMVGPSLGQLFNWFVTNGLPAITQFLSGTVVPAISAFIGVLTRIWTYVQPFVAQLFDWFVNTALPVIVQFIEGTVVPAVQGFISVLSSIWQVVSPVLSALYEWFITSGMPQIVNFIQNTVMSAINGLINIFTTIWGSVEPGLTLFRDNFNTMFTWIIDNVIQPVIDAIQSVVGVAQEVASTVGNVMGGVGDVVSGVGGFINDPIGAVGGILGFAEGGRPPVGVPSVVGERGPELFVPDRAGTIVPNDALAGLGGTTVSIGQISLNVPVEVLRDEPNLVRNARTLAQSLDDEITRNLDQ